MLILGQFAHIVQTGYYLGPDGFVAMPTGIEVHQGKIIRGDGKGYFQIPRSPDGLVFFIGQFDQFFKGVGIPNTIF